MNGRELVTDALIDLGVIGHGDALDHDVAAFVLRKANDWIKSLALERLTVHVRLRTVHTLGSGTASYTIGSGATINIARPTDIEHAGLIIDSSGDPVTEIPIEVFTEQRWQLIRQKDLDSPLVQGIYYDHGITSGFGRIYPWPVPNVGTTQLVIYTPTALQTFLTLDTDYTYANGYEHFLKTNLLKQIAGSFGKSLSLEQTEAAREARGNVKRTNTRAVEATVDPALLVRSSVFDWRTGE
jgi:hypothetical protein